MNKNNKLLRDAIRDSLYDYKLFGIRRVANSKEISDTIRNYLAKNKPNLLKNVTNKEFYHIVREILEHENNCHVNTLFKQKKLKRDIGTVKIDPHGKFGKGTNIYIFGCKL